MPQQHPALVDAKSLPDDLLADVVETFKALSDPTSTARLIYLLTHHEYSVNGTQRRSGRLGVGRVTPPGTAARHPPGAHTRREGRRVFYSIDDAHVGALFHERRSTTWTVLPKHLARIEPYAVGAPATPPDPIPGVHKEASHNP